MIIISGQCQSSLDEKQHHTIYISPFGDAGGNQYGNVHRKKTLKHKSHNATQTVMCQAFQTFLIATSVMSSLVGVRVVGTIGMSGAAAAHAAPCKARLLLVEALEWDRWRRFKACSHFCKASSNSSIP